jgi:hypothetical protein
MKFSLDLVVQRGLHDIFQHDGLPSGTKTGIRRDPANPSQSSGLEGVGPVKTIENSDHNTGE